MDGNQDVTALPYLMKSVTLEQDISESQSVVELPDHLVRVAGILKYIRESADHGLAFDPQSEKSETLLPFQIKCEYCGQEMSPPLDKTCVHVSKASFCCDQWEHLYRLLLKTRNVWQGKSEEIPTANDSSASRHLVYRKEDKLSMFLMDAIKETKSELRQPEDYLIEMPVQNTEAMRSNVTSFRLSCHPMGSWVKLPGKERERKANILETHLNKDDISLSICNHKPLDFGLCHHQDGGDFVIKYYADGLKFLLVLDDGSAQVYYPSGLLAILVTVTISGRVCIVYDDAPGQPMRALFQSDGKGTCYHSSGHIWLIVNQYGGQSLDPEGARVRRWTWHKLGSTPLRPIFLFINKCIGVRVLGKQQIFVSFLANSRQAKFNVGAWCCKGNCKEVTTPPRLAKDELIALAFRVKTRRLIQKYHRFMRTLAHPKLSNEELAPHLQLLAQKLLEAGKRVDMGVEDRDFLQSCLQECLGVKH